MPPLCLVLSLLLLIAGFILVSIDRPEPTVALHAATAADNEKQRDLLEKQLEHKRFQRRVLIGATFGMSLILGATGFLAMKPSG